MRKMAEHGSVEWQLERAEQTLRDIYDIAKVYKTGDWKKVAHMADNCVTNNIITRAAQEAGRKSLAKVIDAADVQAAL